MPPLLLPPSERLRRSILHRKPDDAVRRSMERKFDSNVAFAKADWHGTMGGLTATRDIPKGGYVCAYQGDVLTAEQGYEREATYEASDDAATQECYMLFCRIGFQRYCVDATHSACVGRMANHSREHANARFKLVGSKRVPKVVLVALTDIAKGQWILCDYGDRRHDVLETFTWLKK